MAAVDDLPAGRLPSSLSRLDLDALRAVAAHRAPALDDLARAVMRLGPLDVVVAVVVVVGGWAAATRRVTSTVLPVLAATVVAAGASVALKPVLQRERPPASLALVDAVGFSFPSTSAALGAAPTAALLVLVLARRPGARVAGAVAAVVGVNALVGWSVVYLGAHWPSDVLAGWLLAAVAGSAVVALGRRFARRPPVAAGDTRPWSSALTCPRAEISTAFRGDSSLHDGCTPPEASRDVLNVITARQTPGDPVRARRAVTRRAGRSVALVLSQRAAAPRRARPAARTTRCPSRRW